MPGAQARAQVDRLGLAQRQHRDVQHDAVGHHDRVIAGREGRVQQPQRADRALDLTGQRPALQAHALADAKRPRAQQHRARDQVAERLLRGEAEDHRRERAAQRAAFALRCPRRAARRTARARSSTRRIRKPTVPAVAGSSRRNSGGPRPRPMSRAIAQPRITSTITVDAPSPAFRAPVRVPCAVAAPCAAVGAEQADAVVVEQHDGRRTAAAARAPPGARA